MDEDRWNAAEHYRTPKKTRQQIYELIPKRRDATMDLVDLDFGQTPTLPHQKRHKIRPAISWKRDLKLCSKHCAGFFQKSLRGHF